MLGLQRSDRKKTKKCWNMRKKIQTNSIFVNECEIDKIFLLQVKGTFVLSLSSKFLPYSPFCPPTNGGDENIKLMWCKLHFIHLQNSSIKWVRFLPIVPPSKFLAGSSLYSCAWFVISNLLNVVCSFFQPTGFANARVIIFSLLCVTACGSSCQTEKEMFSW